MWRPGCRYLIINTYYCFLNLKNYNMETVILIANILVIKTFISNISFIVFIFSIKNIKAAINIISWLYVLEYFHFFISKNYKEEVAILVASISVVEIFLCYIFLVVFPFLSSNIGVAINELSWLYISEYFHFSTYKNFNIKAAMLVVITFLSNIFLAIFVFQLQKL